MVSPLNSYEFLFLILPDRGYAAGNVLSTGGSTGQFRHLLYEAVNLELLVAWLFVRLYDSVKVQRFKVRMLGRAAAKSHRD